VKKTLPVPVLKNKAGFTIIEVVIAAVILAFAIFATLRIISSSLSSIARQGKRIRALHIAQACIGRLEGEKFERVVPENFVVPSTPPREYQLKAISREEQIWDKNGGGISINDFEVRAEHPVNKTWNNITTLCAYSNLKITNIPSLYSGQPAYVSYSYYHLIDEGGTIPSSDGNGRKRGTIKLTSEAGNLSNITVEEINSGSPITPVAYSPSTRELSFTSSDEGKSVWIYYLSPRTADSNGDGYQDPTNTSIVGVVQGSFWDINGGGTTNAITPIKRNTITEYWKQDGKIRKIELKTFIEQ